MNGVLAPKHAPARRWPLRLAAALVALQSVLFSTGWSATTQPTEPSRDSLQSAAAHLGDADPSIRLQAATLLRDAGDRSAAELQRAATSADPAMAAAAKELLRLMAQDKQKVIPHASSPAVAHYHDSNVGQRRQMIMEMGGRGGAATLARFWEIEPDPELRALAFHRLLAYPSASAAALLAEGNEVAARTVLEVALLDHSTDALEAYAAYCVCRGTLDDAIERWSARAAEQPPDAWPQRVLSLLYRARGGANDARAAIDCARKSQDQQAIEDALFAAGDYAGLADAIRHRPIPPTRTREWALLMACDHLAGNDARALLDDLQKIATSINAPDEVAVAANAMVLCDRPEDAIQLLEAHGELTVAFEILVAQWRYGAALEMLHAHDADDARDATEMRARSVRLFNLLGEKEKAREMIARVTHENQRARDPEAFLALGEAAREAGHAETAWADFSSALCNEPHDSPVAAHLARIFEDSHQEIDWYALWRLLQESNPPGFARQNFATMRSIHDRTIPPEQVRELARWNGHGPVNSPVRAQLLCEAASRLASAGQPQAAETLLETEAQRLASPDLYLRAGDIAADQRHWHSAAAWYQAAWTLDPLQSLPLYLRGMALRNAGEVAAGVEARRLARVLSLGNDYGRYQVVRELDQRGMTGDVAGEAAVLARVAQPLGVGADIAARVLGTDAERRNDAAAEQTALRGMLLRLANGFFRFRERSAYVALALRVHRTAARAALAAGDLEGTEREAAAYNSLSPDEIGIAVNLVPELERRGHRAEADAMFKRTLAAQDKLCAQYPDSANQQNQWAWLAAECDRALDRALEHAKRAVELDPKRTAYIDTLAEVCFRRGEIDQAINEIKKCIALEPAVARHRAQLARFQAARSTSKK